MLVAQMIVELRSRLDEKALTDKLITLAQKYEKLNASALFLANNMDADRFLQSLINTGGVIASPAEVNILGSPIGFVKFHDVYDSTSTATRHRIANMVDVSMGPVLRNQFTRPNAEVLTCAFDGKSNLFVYNETIPSSLTWRYIKEPVTITESQETDIDDRLHEILLDYAEYLCWVQLDDPARANAIMQSVMAQIVKLNPKQEEVKS